MSGTTFDPYQPPLAAFPVHGGTTWIDGQAVSTECIQRGWLNRTIAVSGAVAAVIRYEGRGFGEHVYVNNVHVASTSMLEWRVWNIVSPRVDFRFEDGEMLYKGRIDVQGSWTQLLNLAHFILSINDVVVYEEGA